MLTRAARALVLFVFASALFGQGAAVFPSYPAGSEPECNAAGRGSVILSLGGTGQPDLLKICARNGLGRLAWTVTGRQNTNTFTRTRFVGGCPLFPDNSVWNSRADALSVDPGSAAIIATYKAAPVGVDTSMALNLADDKTPAAPVSLDSPESDHGFYPLTPDMKVEGYSFPNGRPVSGGPFAGDAHLLALRTDECKLYEIYRLRDKAPPYHAESGAIYDLLSNDLRKDGWTSADAAGLPIWPGVLTYAELFGADEIRHMIRFTVRNTRNTYVWPARHYASHDGSPALPPMGSRWRLRADFDAAACRAGAHVGEAFPPEIARLVRALKTYGMILADNGMSILLTSDSDPRWGDPRAPDSPVARVNQWTHCIAGKDFEVVNGADLMTGPQSAATSR